MNGSHTVLMCFVGTAGFIIANRYFTNKTPVISFKQAEAGTLVFLTLGIASTFVPDVAAALAIGVVVVVGLNSLPGILNATSLK